MKSRRDIGNWGEVQAAGWLEQNGYTILNQNYHARIGEIDIVARHIASNRLCFVEVKTRKRRDGTAEYANTPAKQQKSRLAAIRYCQEHDIDVEHEQISFEHVSVYRSGGIDHYELPAPSF